MARTRPKYFHVTAVPRLGWIIATDPPEAPSRVRFQHRHCILRKIVIETTLLVQLSVAVAFPPIVYKEHKTVKLNSCDLLTDDEQRMSYTRSSLFLFDEDVTTDNRVNPSVRERQSVATVVELTFAICLVACKPLIMLMFFVRLLTLKDAHYSADKQKGSLENFILDMVIDKL
ncbi:unnamed protein product [Angiostrongylus costaricensis]|uniref:G_PROTEIN_RECEP_F1_2 domain-containing protein n=1 Tax=Angiostrongylus costaricensis TaxID=334426 RepID=A0A0R3PX70_ANGCS|nr:unnamed protein product [Angiostrongylus costaricensis]